MLRASSRRSATRLSPWVDFRDCRQTLNSSTFFSTCSGFFALSFRPRVLNRRAERRCSTHAPPVIVMLVVGGALPSIAAISYLWMQDALELYLDSNFGTYGRYLAARSSQDIWNGLKHGL